MLSLAGMPFEVFPEALLTAAEKEMLASLSSPALRRGEKGTPFRLCLADSPWTRGALGASPEGAPAAVSEAGGHILLSHRNFVAELEPLRRIGRLYRQPGHTFPLEITLRIALSSTLPLEGSLPLHAAGLVVAGQGVVFFGVSGAGKSTLARAAPYPVLSDELVAVVGGETFGVMGSGFWGGLGEAPAPSMTVPLGALVQLDKGPAFRWAPLSPRDALSALLDVILVPPGAELWSSALGILPRLLGAVPAYRMAWSPAEAPFEALEEALATGHPRSLAGHP